MYKQCITGLLHTDAHQSVALYTPAGVCLGKVNQGVHLYNVHCTMYIPWCELWYHVQPVSPYSTPCLCSFSESVGVWLAFVWMQCKNLQCKNLQEALEKSLEGHAVWTRVHPLLSFNSSARLSTSVCHCFHPKVATTAFIHKVKSSYKWHFENPVANRVCMKVVNSTQPWAGHSIIEAYCASLCVGVSSVRHKHTQDCKCSN